MHYWLIKSEPDVWSIEQQKKAGKKGVAWDGVRNYQAANYLKKMKTGDLCFFYHSNIGKEIVGIVQVIKEHYLDKTDQSSRFVAVTVKFLEKLKSVQKKKKKIVNLFFLISINNKFSNVDNIARAAVILAFYDFGKQIIHKMWKTQLL